MSIRQIQRVKRKAKAVLNDAARWYVMRHGETEAVRRICQLEYRSQVFSSHNERPIEYRFALEVIGQRRPTSVLDVGTGTTSWPHLLHNCGCLVTAIDNVRDYWPEAMSNRHWTVLDIDIGDPVAVSRLKKHEAITCISVLEHIEDHVRAVRNMAALLEPNGTLILTTPFSWNNPHPNVYVRDDALYGKDFPFICRSSSVQELHNWLDAGFELIHKELWRLFTGPVWATGERCTWQRAESQDAPHQLGCFAFRKV